jgi:cyclopropane-fatty-acyl-phospholipid synthase
VSLSRTLATPVLHRLREGHVEIVDGRWRRAFGPGDAGLRTAITVHDAARFWPAVARASTPALADTYADGGWDCDDLVTLVRVFAREMPRLDACRRPFVPLRNAFTRIPRNTRSGARRHIQAHYDLGNDLFALFLDETLTYSCALFDSREDSLADAQRRKLELVCRKLQLTPADHLLEIGSGWGSLALHAAGEHGCRVTTTTISREQHELTVERVREAGLDDLVTVLLEDYRDLRGRYDKLVSIEMIEAVGWQYFDTFFSRCGELLKPDGLMLLQAITIDDRAFEIEKASRSFIKEHIFPAGCLPSVETIARSIATATRLRMLDLHDITANYTETIARWRQAFAAAAERAAQLGYDRRFRRLWDLYLCWCEGGFHERRIGDVQVLLAGPAYRGSRLDERRLGRSNGVVTPSAPPGEPAHQAG